MRIALIFFYKLVIVSKITLRTNKDRLRLSVFARFCREIFLAAAGDCIIVLLFLLLWLVQKQNDGLGLASQSIQIPNSIIHLIISAATGVIPVRVSSHLW